MSPYIAELSKLADTFISCYPKAGLPNAFGEYDELPQDTALIVGEFAESGLVNIVGGCCGTTPAHIGAIAKAGDGLPSRVPGEIAPVERLAGLETLNLNRTINFCNVEIGRGSWGERRRQDVKI